MGTFLKIVQIISKYGSKAAKWCWDHKDQILNWINIGQGIEWIVNQIKHILHIK